MECKICNNKVSPAFTKNILGKYNVTYYKCDFCEFIQVENPYWLNEAYQEAISDFDIGLVDRNLRLSEITRSIIKVAFNKKLKFIDFAGGYGLLTRLMRNKGFDFYRQDKYCENIFSKKFDVLDCSASTNFELLTAFEVFEHLPNPPEELENMFKYSSSIFFTTEIYPNDLNKLSEWWYLSPETGQHIAFYSKKTLTVLAQKFKCRVYSNWKDLHLFTNKKFIVNPILILSFFHNLIDFIFSRNFQNKRSLLPSDYKMLKGEINKQ